MKILPVHKIFPLNRAKLIKGFIDIVTRHTTKATPNTIPASSHKISRADISENAIDVLLQLNRAGFEGYLVGGSVRDLILGRKPKDFDIVTNAHPDQVRQIFKRRCILIGRRFRLAHVRFGREIIEVATFRGREDAPDAGDRVTVNGRIVRDNVYGASIAEDVWRRDFSVNSLYYGIVDHCVIDFTGGMADLEARTLRLIGEPEMRYREDAVRTLRAIRFAAKLDFQFHPDTEAPIREFGRFLEDVPPARLFEEVLKLFHGGHALPSYRLLRRHGLFEQLFPATESLFAQLEPSEIPIRLLERALANTDARIDQGKSVNPSFLFAALLWGPVQQLAERHRKRGMPPTQAMDVAARHVIDEQVRHVLLPRRFSAITKEIWAFQSRLARQVKRRPKQTASHPRFRAAYDFLVLRAESGEKDLQPIARWWTDYQEKNPLPQESHAPKSSRGRRGRSPGRRSRP